MSRTSILFGFALSSIALAACMAKEAPPMDMVDGDMEVQSVGSVGETTAVASEKSVDAPVTLADAKRPATVSATVTPAKPAPRPEPEVAEMEDDFSMDADMGAVAAPGRGGLGNRASASGQVASVTRSPASPKVKAKREKKADRNGYAAGPTGGGALRVPTSGGDYAPPPPPVEVMIDEEPMDSTVAQSSSGEGYRDHGVNPYTVVTDDALSTFSIDVDTASYTISRRKLNESTLPPTASVRVEEFVNAFDYDYRPPMSGDAPFAVHMEAMPDPFRDGHHTLRVGVQGQEIGRLERAPVHLTFLVDVSGSMSAPDKLGLAKESMHMLVDNLNEHDTVALATYAGRVARILEPTSASDKRQIHKAINQLNSGGSTAMSSGLDLAYEMAWESFEPGTENRVVVMSDGDANVGRTSWDDMLGQIKGYADKGVTLSTIGFGMGNYQDNLMEQLSNKGDGNNYYIDSEDQAKKVFVDDLGGTMFTIARDVKIQVDFNPESVAAYRLVGYENRDIADKDFRNDRVDAGEIGAGHNVTAVYDVILKDGYARDLATVRMRWEAPGADKAASEKAYTFRSTALKERTEMAGKNTRMAYATATFAEILRDSPYTSEISMSELIAFTRQAVRAGDADQAELLALMTKAAALGAGSGSTVAVR